MGLKNSLAFFQKEYKKERKNVPTLSGKGVKANNIFTYTLREDEVGRQLAASAIRALKGFKGKISKQNYSFITSTGFCTDQAKVVLDGIRQRRRVQLKAAASQHKQLTFPFVTPTGLFKFPPWKSFTGKPGIYVLQRTLGGRGVSIRFVSGSAASNDTAVQNVNKDLRDMLWNSWLARASAFYSGTVPKRTVTNALKYEMQIAHDEETTVGAMMLKSLKENKPDMVITGTITTTEVVDQIEKNLGIDLDRNYEKTKNGFRFKWNITASLKFNQAGSEITDRERVKSSFKRGSMFPTHKKVPGQLGVTEYGQAAKALIQLYQRKHGTYATQIWILRGSEPPKQQAIEGHSAELIDGIVRPLTKAGRPDMRFKVNKRVKNFKKTKDSGVIKKAEKARKPKTKTIIRSQRIAGTYSRPQKDKRKGTQNISRLQALINKRLPAEVRRNMGRPALVNRSGTFSNSPEVVKIRQHPTKGLTADYTYMKTGGGTPPRSGQPGVYQTFENKGRWPAGYNPKDLIKKSIRNLALQYTEEKFVQLRRV